MDRLWQRCKWCLSEMYLFHSVFRWMFLYIYRYNRPLNKSVYTRRHFCTESSCKVSEKEILKTLQKIIPYPTSIRLFDQNGRDQIINLKKKQLRSPFNADTQGAKLSINIIEVSELLRWWLCEFMSLGHSEQSVKLSVLQWHFISTSWTIVSCLPLCRCRSLAYNSCNTLFGIFWTGKRNCLTTGSIQSCWACWKRQIPKFVRFHGS